MSIRTGLLCIALLLAGMARAQMSIGQWTPIFKGVDYSVSTNLPDTSIPRLQVVHTVRVDLHDPDIELFSTPQIDTNYVQNFREIASYTPTDFLTRNELQLVINANFFSQGTYYLPPATPMDLYGLAVSQGTLVSPHMAGYSRAIVFDATNKPTLIPQTSAAMNLDGIWTAVAGNYLILTNGTNANPTFFDLDPRTVFGISEDRRYLFLAAFDGRQPGYSDGATHRDTAIWMKALGAHEAINVDGGGSTTLVMEGSTGEPVRLNSSSAVADSGRERTVGSHFGIWAKAVPSFFTNVVVQAGISTATISFTTLARASSEVHYGTATELTTTNVASASESSEHIVELTGLTPETRYFYRLAALSNGVPQLSPLYQFTTTNLTVTNLIFDYTNIWRYSHTAWNGTTWTTESENDTNANWFAGPGLLWIDSRNIEGVEPRSTELPINPSTGFPYITYYFRTRFDVGEITEGSALLFQGKIDDGAVFYLNGVEFYRLRMPATSDSSTLASGFPCSGDATCVDEFKIPFSAISNLRETNNLLAVEVHNYNARSGDTTFGVALSRIDVMNTVTPAELTVALTDAGVEISWQGDGGTLESAATADGEWTTVETTSTNRLVVPIGTENRFYRLRR